MYSKLNHYFTTRKFTSSFVLNVMLLMSTSLCSLLIVAVQESKFNSRKVQSNFNSTTESFDFIQASLIENRQPMNQLSLQNVMPTFTDLDIERFNHSLSKKNLRISHQKNKIVKLESISLILFGLTIISLFTAARMYRKHHKLISGLQKHGLPSLKESPDMAAELLINHVPTVETGICLSQNDINQMLVSSLKEAVDIWLTANDQSLVEFAYQSQIWTITNDNGSLRVRSLERYLSIDKIPKNPRWKNVTKSIGFVLSTLDKDDHHYLKLNEMFHELSAKLESYYG